MAVKQRDTITYQGKRYVVVRVMPHGRLMVQNSIGQRRIIKP